MVRGIQQRNCGSDVQSSAVYPRSPNAVRHHGEEKEEEIPEDNSEHHTRRRENLKSHELWVIMFNKVLIKLRFGIVK
jgi:hypothetical protein